MAIDRNRFLEAIQTNMASRSPAPVFSPGSLSDFLTENPSFDFAARQLPLLPDQVIKRDILGMPVPKLSKFSKARTNQIMPRLPRMKMPRW